MNQDDIGTTSSHNFTKPDDCIDLLIEVDAVKAFLILKQNNPMIVTKEISFYRVLRKIFDLQIRFARLPLRSKELNSITVQKQSFVGPIFRNDLEFTSY
jgi:hypothetical protein